MEFTIKELEKIINEGDFNHLIGKIENDFFDCKREIYYLQNKKAIIELAKDVSSFANLNGGYILIGPKTDPSITHFGDEVTEISLLDQNLVNPAHYIDIIKNWIYPNEIDGIKIYWKASKDNHNKGIVVIEIPPQKDSSKPFLINRIVEVKNNKMSEIIFGYAERREDKSDHKSVKDVHKIMRDGLLYDKKIENRFNNLESIVQSFSKKRSEEEQKAKDGDLINKRVDEILKLYGHNNE